MIRVVHRSIANLATDFNETIWDEAMDYVPSQTGTSQK